MDIQKQIQEYFNTKLSKTHLRDLLQDQQRNEALVAEFDGVLLDYTHEKVDVEVLNKFQQLCDELHLNQKINDIFNGAKVNSTENRSVLHVALRAQPQQSIQVEGHNVVNDVHHVLQRIQKFTDSVRSGEVRGFTNKKLQNVVLIGIGGSYLGIEFIYEALRTHAAGYENSQGRRLRLLANVDPIDSQRALEGLNVEETLFVINSKTFTTAETIMNARRCRQWILDEYQKLGVNDEKGVLASHLCAVSTNLVETGKFGIADDRVFGFWDWVGGRFSVSSAIGMLPLSLHFGFVYMLNFLDGANAMDKHLASTPKVAQNLPMLLGFLGWYRASIQKYQSLALIPYTQSLLRFPAHIQQVHMESNGKTTLLGPQQEFLPAACPLVFGEPGTNSQHSFFQLVHQGTYVVPCEFIGYARSQTEDTVAKTPEEKAQVRDQHDELMSNYFAQVDALARGKTAEEVRAEGVKEELVQHKVFPGDRSSLSLLFDKEVNPYNVGQLLALYEHRVLVEGLLWGINSFDQWGVELGKVLAKNVKSVLSKNVDPNQEVNFDGFNANSATKNLIRKYRKFQKQ